ncbi:MAG TPA: endonuclease III [Ignavibacteriaceae bacterium]|nr:endonuclease III [Ignavibacteriaceae bacterium]
MKSKIKTEPGEVSRKYAEEIFKRLKKEYPNPKTALNFKTPFQLLIATILSAQCTDARVNIVTKDLFLKYLTPGDYLKVPDDELEGDIHSTGFFKQKAKSIKLCCRELIDKHGGKVPSDFDALNELPGVGRKTASVVAGNAFGIPAIAVDTHVKRLSNRLGFIDSEDPEKIELRLKELVPQKDWINSSHWLILHGRTICNAKRPKCAQCILGDLCPSFNPAA